MLKTLMGIVALSLAATAAHAKDHHPSGLFWWLPQIKHERNDDRDSRNDNRYVLNYDSKLVAAPEIDPAGLFSGLTLLTGGLAVIRGRRSKK